MIGNTSLADNDVCKYRRVFTTDQLLKGTEIFDIFKLLGCAFLLLFSSIVVYSMARAYGEKYFRLGHNIMRWRFTRIYYFRFAPQCGQPPEPSDESFRSLTRRNILTWRFTWAWIFQTMSFKDDDVEREAGLDGRRYLSFSRKILVILLTYTICLQVVGDGSKKLSSLWGATLLANVVSSSTFVEETYILIGILNLLVAMGIFIWFGISNKLFGFDRLTETNPAVLFISRIDAKDCKPDVIERYISERAGPKPLQITNVDLIKRNAARLEHLREELDIMQQTRARLENLPNKKFICVPVCNLRNRFEASVYYRNEEARLHQEIDKAESDETFTGLAFVHFKDEEEARAAMRSFGKFARWGPILPDLIHSCIARFFNQDENPKGWFVSFARPERDIKLDNLVKMNPHNFRLKRFLTWLLIFSVVIVGVLAPPYIEEAMKNNSLFAGFFSEMIMFPTMKFCWFMVVLSVIRCIDNVVVKTPVKSNRHINIMQWVLYFMALNDLLMPLLDEITVNSFFSSLWSANDDELNLAERISCIFREKLGSGIAKSIVIACTTRSVMLQLRLTHHFDISPWLAKTTEEADVRHSRKSIKADMGYRYADYIYLYFMAIAVALSQPLVPWCAVLCMFARYWVDKHCLCQTYDKTEHADELHRKVIPLVFQPFLFQSGAHLCFLNFMNGADGRTASASALAITYFTLAALIYIGFYLYIHYWVESKRYFLRKRQEDDESLGEDVTCLPMIDEEQ